MKKKEKQFRKIWILAWIIASFLAGWVLRDKQGWTAKMPEHDEPPQPTPIIDQVSICGDDNWDYVNKKITRKCIIYDRETWQNVPID